MADFPVDEAQVIALFVVSILYGIFLVTFGMTIRTLLFTARNSAIDTGKQHYFFLAVAIAMFLVASFEEAVVLRHVLDAFIFYKGPGGAIAEFSIISYWVNVMKSMNYCIMTAIGDAVLIYRCFYVWGKNWYIVAGLGVLWVAGLVVAALEWYTEFTLHSNALLSTSNLRPYVQAVQSITLCLNLIATSLIIFKIYRVQKASAAIIVRGGGSSGALSRAMRIIVESGLLYSAGVIVFFATYLASSTSQYIAADAVVPIIGISFNLIIIRVSQGRTIETTIATSQAISGPPRFSGSDARSQSTKSHPSHFRFYGNRSGDTTTYDDDADFGSVSGKGERVKDGHVLVEIVRSGPIRFLESEEESGGAASGRVDDVADKV